MSISRDTTIKLYQSIANANEERVFEHWHASSIASCPRAHYFHRLGIPTLTKPTGGRVIRWGAGHHLEAVIRPHVEAVYGATMSNDRMTSEKLQLTGEFDNYVIEGDRLVEIKSVSAWAFVTRNGETSLKQATGELNKWGKNTFEPRQEPYISHQLQNHAYVMLLAEQGKEVKGIDYIYISLDGQLVVYTTQVQQKYLDNVSKRLEALNEAWETKVPPVCICRDDHPLYQEALQWCDYKEEGKCCSLSLIKEK
jgi:hypothetical protein